MSLQAYRRTKEKQIDREQVPLLMVPCDITRDGTLNSPVVFANVHCLELPDLIGEFDADFFQCGTRHHAILPDARALSANYCQQVHKQLGRQFEVSIARRDRPDFPAAGDSARSVSASCCLMSIELLLLAFSFDAYPKSYSGLSSAAPEKQLVRDRSQSTTFTRVAGCAQSALAVPPKPRGPD